MLQLREETLREILEMLELLPAERRNPNEGIYTDSITTCLLGLISYLTNST